MFADCFVTYLPDRSQLLTAKFRARMEQQFRNFLWYCDHRVVPARELMVVVNASRLSGSRANRRLLARASQKNIADLAGVWPPDTPTVKVSAEPALPPL